MCDKRITSYGIPIDATITKELQETLEEWLPMRAQTIVKLHALAKELGSLTKRTNVAQVVGSSASLAGGIGTVASIVAAPFTGGLSLVLGSVCLALGVSGAATTVGTAIAKDLIESDVVKKAQDAIVKEGKMADKMNSCLLKFKEELERGLELSKKAKMAAGVCKTAIKGAKLVRSVLPPAKLGASTLLRLSPKASKFVGTIAKGARIVGKALTVISIPIDIYQVSRTAIDIANGSPNEIAAQVMGIAHELQEEYDTLKELLEDIKDK